MTGPWPMFGFASTCIAKPGSLPMNRHMVSLFDLVAKFQPAFARSESAHTFEHVVVAWILCLRCRTLSEVWQISGLKGHYDAIYSLFASACWDWDELGAILCTLLITHLLPDGVSAFADASRGAVVSCLQGEAGDGVFGPRRRGVVA